jgi:hypothetical protein
VPQAEIRASEDKLLRDSRVFRAQPATISGSSWAQLSAEAAALRRRRVEERAALMSSIAHMPQRMAQHEAQRVQAAAAGKGGSGSGGGGGAGKAGAAAQQKLSRRSLSPEKVRRHWSALPDC